MSSPKFVNRDSGRGSQVPQTHARIVIIVRGSDEVQPFGRVPGESCITQEVSDATAAIARAGCKGPGLIEKKWYGEAQ